MTLSEAVTEYLTVLDSGSYSTKRLATALNAVREALTEPSESAPEPKPKGATKK